MGAGAKMVVGLLSVVVKRVVVVVDSVERAEPRDEQRRAKQQRKQAGWTVLALFEVVARANVPIRLPDSAIG